MLCGQAWSRSPPLVREPRGYRDAYKVRPRFVFGRDKGRFPNDLERFHDHWIVSDRMKSVMEQVDSDAFDFAACDIILKDGSPGPRYWLCDVVRVLDAVDETISNVRFSKNPGEAKIYAIIGNSLIHFRNDVVGSAHIFRLKYNLYHVAVDDTFKNACRAAGLKGIHYDEISDPVSKN